MHLVHLRLRIVPIIFYSLAFTVKFDGVNVWPLGEFVNETVKHLHNARRLLAGVVVHSHEFAFKKRDGIGIPTFITQNFPLYFLQLPNFITDKLLIASYWKDLATDICEFLAPYRCQSQVKVKVGMKSRPGMISSKKLKIPPKAPFQPLKQMKKTRAEMGAQTTSVNSPTTGRV